MLRIRLIALFALAVLLVGCGPLAAVVPSAPTANAPSELTLIYTGYGRGFVDPQAPCG